MWMCISGVCEYMRGGDAGAEREAHVNVAMAPALTEAVNKCSQGSPSEQPIVVASHAHNDCSDVSATDGHSDNHTQLNSIWGHLHRQHLRRNKCPPAAGDILLQQHIRKLTETVEAKTMNGGDKVPPGDCEQNTTSGKDPNPEVTEAIMTCANIHTAKSERSTDRENAAAARRLAVERRLEELRQRQTALDRRSERKLRRVSKLEALQAGHHVADQLARLVEYHERAALTGNLPTANRDCERLTVRGEGGLLQNDGVKSLSTAALVNLVRKLETGSSPIKRVGQVQQHGCGGWPSGGPAALQRLQQMKVGGVGAAVSTAGQQEPTASGLTADGKVRKEVAADLTRTSGSLNAVLTTVQRNVDSDATESSSGGESCDELDSFEASWDEEVTDKTRKTKQKPINKRAAWNWAVYRGAVASRWTWLQAQVSEIEYRVRQQNDMYRQLRVSKDPVIVAEPVTSAAKRLSANSTLNMTVETTKNNLVLGTGAQGSGYRPQGNGYVVVCGGSTTEGTGGEGSAPEDESSCSAVRTKPLRAFRKRKLVRLSAAAVTLSRKATKMSSLRCSCQFPDSCCVLCLGRFNRVQALDPDTMSEEERVALLDSSFHPVLSFPEDKPLTLQFGKQLRSDDWMKVVQKPKATPGVKKKGAIKSGSKDPAHKHCRKLKKNATATLTAIELRKKLKVQKRSSRGRSLSAMRATKRELDSERLHKKRAAKRMAIAMKKRRARSLSFSSGGSSKPGSPTPSVGQGENSSGSSQNYQTYQSEHGRRSSLLQDFIRRRRGENAFDINNIVIPYSMAAATRVERLQYKEILTPKWRMVDEPALSGQLKNNGLVQCVTRRDDPDEEEQSDKEDMSEDLFVRRHDKCEHEEKKRFMSYMHPSGSRRTRTNLRSDSRADSSGANTPDPMSPHQLEQESPLTTPPSTPAPSGSSLIHEDFAATAASGVSGGGLIHSRRRTTSLSRGIVTPKDRDRWPRDRTTSEDARTSTPDIEVVPVAPWDPRQFPMTEEDFEAMQRASTAASLEEEEREKAEKARKVCEDVEDQREDDEEDLMSTRTPVTDREESESRSLPPDEDPQDPEWTAPALPVLSTAKQMQQEGIFE